MERGIELFNTDKPINDTKSDLLNRASFAKQLASAILSYTNTDNFTISICGKWGSGKTSILNLMEENIINLGSAEKALRQQKTTIYQISSIIHPQDMV